MNAVTKLLSCSEIKELDCKTTENKKITSLDLMSDAVLAVENWILNNYKKNQLENFSSFHFNRFNKFIFFFFFI